MWCCSEAVGPDVNGKKVHCARWTLAKCTSCHVSRCDLHLHRTDDGQELCSDHYNDWLQRAGAESYHPDPRDVGI